MRNKLLTIPAIAALLFSSSCRRELLTPTLTTSVADAQSFDTPDRVLNQVRSLYSVMKSGAYYGGRVVVYGDIRGEDFINETTNLITNSDVWSLNPTNSATAITGLWGQCYLVINECNVFIDGMNAKGTAVVGAAVGANYVAEARLIRALAYYSLLQYYARPYTDGNGSKPGLPLRLTGVTAAGQSDLVRSTVAEVYTAVLADLDFAETNLPLTYTTDALNASRAHRNTAIALKTRVYLSMGKYSNVITEGNKIVSTAPPFNATSGVNHSLQSDITNVFKTYITKETIMSMPMSSTSGDNPGTQNQLGYYYYQNGSTPGNAEFSLNASGIIANTNWTAGDKRRSFLFQNATSKKYYLSKYPSPSPYLDYPQVIRYSEVMLNLAEALARTSATPDARALLLVNAVRQRSDPSTTVVAATQADLIAAILLERRIEFLGEGLRNNDLMRLLQTIPAKGTAQAKTPSDNGYIWPISSTELSLNKLMVDN